MKNYLKTLVLVFSVILLTACSTIISKSAGTVQVDNITRENYSKIELLGAEINFSAIYEEYIRGEISFRESLGDYTSGKSNFILSDILNDPNNGNEYTTFKFYKDGEIFNKRIFRNISKGGSLAFSGKQIMIPLAPKEDIYLFVASYSSSATQNNIQAPITATENFKLFERVTLIRLVFH